MGHRIAQRIAEAIVGVLVLQCACGPAERPLHEPDVIYLATPQPLVEKMLELAEVKKDDIVYDLGCGDGRIAVTAAVKYGARSFGWDIDPRRLRESRANAEKNKVQDLVTIELGDIFELDLSKADVVMLYLKPELNFRLIPQLEKLKPGSRIVSHEFAMRGVKPRRVIALPSDDRDHKLYLWVTPLERQH
jgi:SAM-dependent methyltransferase